MNIINILNQTPQEIIYQFNDYKEYQKRFPETEFLEVKEKVNCVGFFKFDWHHQWGKHILNLSQEIVMECWRPYGNQISQKYEKQVDKIKHKVFPSNRINVKKVGSFERSPLMIDELKNYDRKNTVIHIYGAHNGFVTWFILQARKLEIPIVVQQLGGWFGYFDFKTTKNPLKLIPYYFEKLSLKYISKYLTASVVEFDFLKENFKNLDFEFFLNGIDFTHVKVVEKQEAKKNLKIPFDKKMILYVGSLTDVKNVNILIDTFNILKEKRDDIVLYLVGGYKSEKYFNYAIESGAVVIERTDNPIDGFYNAADVYVLPTTDKYIADFGGIGIAVLEALAHNTPVISRNLNHFSLNKNLNLELGEVDYNKFNLADNIENIIDKKTNTRPSELCEIHYDINKNSKRIIMVYKNILNDIKE